MAWHWALLNQARKLTKGMQQTGRLMVRMDG